MATATVGALRVELGLDSAAFTDGMKAAQKRLRDAGRAMQSVGATMATVGAGMTAAITGPLIAAGFAASKASTEAKAAMGQVEASLNSMGNASGRTAEQLDGLASDIMRHSLLDDDDVLRQVTTNLLTFGRVSGTVFDRAQQVIVDYSAKTGRDLLGSTMLIGRALQDPIKGMNQLGRAGVILTDAQKALIRSMDAAGNTAGAQGILLAELETQFKGSAQAAQDTDPYDSLRDSLNDLSESMGAIINTHLKPFIDGVAALADRFNGLTPRVQGFVVAGAAIAAALGPALIVIGGVVSAVGALAAAFATGGVLAGLAGLAVAAAPFIAAGAAIAAVVYIFRDDLGPILKEFGDAARAALGPAMAQALAAARQAFADLGPAIKTILDVAGPVLAALAKLFLQVFGPIVLTALRVLVAGFTNAVGIITRTVQVIAAVLSGDWSGAWRAAGSLAMEMVRGLGRLIEAVFPGIGRIVGRMVDEVRGFLGRQLMAVFNAVVEKVRIVGDAFHDLWDRVVGHSYVPDMVEGIAEWMAKLDAGMVVPAARATEAVRDHFEAVRDDVAAIMERLLTDTERAALQLARETASINEAVRLGQMTRANGDIAIAGIAGENLTLGTNPVVGDIQSAVDFQQMLRDGLKDAQDAFDDTARQFGDAFAGNMERVLRGDIKGVFLDILSDSVRASFASVGQSFFKAFGSKSGGLDFGKIGSSISNVLGGFHLPGFATGGGFTVGGNAGIDKNLVAFRASKGEMVDIRRPGQGMDNGGALAVHVTPSPYFDVQVARVASPVAAQAGVHAFGAARSAVPADLAKQQAYRTR